MAISGMGIPSLFPQSSAFGEGLNPDPKAQIVWTDVGIGIVPIGAIVSWCKSLTGVPPLLPNFVECNGQVLSDTDSLLNGQTIPDLNGNGGTKRFLRGSATSGTTGGTETHTHGPGATVGTYGGTSEVLVPRWTDIVTSSASGTLPSYFEVVFIMRIK